MCTAKEKMLNGEFYNAWDETLVEDRDRAKSLLFEFNQINPAEREKRLEALKKLIPDLGDNPWIESPFNCDYGTNLTIGDHFYANTNCTILDCAKVTIGNHVLIGPNVGFYTPNHAYDAQERIDGWEKSLPITIGDAVWIGGSVTVLGGVSIGKNSIIGAGSVVTKSIPDNVIAAGNPCRVLREITEADRINLTQ